ncbi:MAG: NYN domain-containing protein [Gemmatimonadetes bacterium]|nr:NYN domain-containing protein [Gemmatimonadota bacterium]MYC16149.1 NYN domain-containing protein [Gemmatimonadota bacterium]MYK53540.1 NYN domain-containing protein [Gemmatimonadota bacterium]
MADFKDQIVEIQEAIARIEQKLDQINIAQASIRDLREIKNRVYKEAISGARERREIFATLDAIQKSIAALQANARARLDRRTDIPAPELRVGIFVDVQNIFYAAKPFNARLDFEKLLELSVGKRRLIRAIAYVVQSPDVDQSNFISMLQQKSYEVKRKDLRQRSDGSAKGDWDMGMAIDIMRFVDKLDVVVLVSGDGDFVPLVDLVKTLGPRVEVISFTYNTARDLINSADEHIPIEEALLLRNSAQAESAT